MFNLKTLILIFPFLMFGCSSEQNKTSPQSDSESQIRYEKIWQQGGVHFVFIENDSSINRSEYRKIAINICEKSSICAVAFWDEKSQTPNSSLPMTDAQAKSKVAHYHFNRNTNYERLLICEEDGC